MEQRREQQPHKSPVPLHSGFYGALLFLLLVGAIIISFVGYSSEPSAPVGMGAEVFYNQDDCVYIRGLYNQSLYNAEKYMVRAEHMKDIKNEDIGRSYCYYANVYLTDALRYKEAYDDFCGDYELGDLLYNYSVKCIFD